MTLSDRISQLEGVRPCAEGYIARCPVHDDKKASLSIRETESGKLLIKCFAGCEYPAIISALDGRPLSRVMNSSGGARMPKTALNNAKRTEFAVRTLRESQPAAGTIVAVYLRSRGITMMPPRSLRFHPSLKHPSGVFAPAMVAGVQDREGRFVAIHRTWLKSDGSGKANVEPQKALLGPCAGGAIRFAKPASSIAIAEGIETALSIAQACPDLPVWAAMSTSGMRALKLPACVREAILFIDADPAGECAAEATADRFAREGRKVSIARPAGANDFNDVLRT